MRTIVLASASPWRKEILEKTHLPFTVAPSDFAENMNQNLPPEELTKQLSHGKAQAVAKDYPDALIIGADTVLFFNGKIGGKPRDEQETRNLLSQLSDNCHVVFTGFTILDTKTGKSVSQSVETKVYLKKLTDSEIDNYIKTKEPLGKAGAYAIQGLGALLVEKIEGDYYNVMGLPLSAVAEALKKFGIHAI